VPRTFHTTADCVCSTLETVFSVLPLERHEDRAVSVASKVFRTTYQLKLAKQISDYYRIRVAGDPFLLLEPGTDHNFSPRHSDSAGDVSPFADYSEGSTPPGAPGAPLFRPSRHWSSSSSIVTDFSQVADTFSD
jgi:hypothetical protein